MEQILFDRNSGVNEFRNQYEHYRDKLMETLKMSIIDTIMDIDSELNLEFHYDLETYSTIGIYQRYNGDKFVGMEVESDNGDGWLSDVNLITDVDLLLGIWDGILQSLN